MLRLAPFRLDRRVTIALTAAAVLVPAGSASAATRYAANYRFPPTGTGDCTNPAKPCTLTTALAAAVSGDDVSLAPGTYRAPGIAPVINPGKAGPGEVTPVTQPPYSDPVVVPPGVTLHGTDPTKLPAIVVAPNAQAEAGVELGKNSKIVDVGIVGKAATNAAITYSLSLGEASLAERVRVTTTASSGVLQIGVSMGLGSTLRSSVSRGIGTGLGANNRVVAVSASGRNQTSFVRNVTAISTTDGGQGISNGTSDGVNTITISNSIVRGTASDIRVRSGVTGGQSTANVDHSNWITQDVSAVSGATAVLQQTGGNQSAGTAAEPLFFDAAAGDFRQMPGSPTINAGVVDLNNGLLALGGALRRIGVTTDIGADEFDPANPPTVPQPPEEPESPEPTTPEPTTPTPTAPAGDPPPPPVDRTAPVISNLSLGKKFKRSKGTTIRFLLSEPANVALAFAQPRSGRLMAGKCVKTTRKNRKQPRCTQPNLRGTVIIAGKAGLNTLTFKGALTAKKRLAFGSYALNATATDAAGNKSATATKRFTLTR